MNRFFSKLDLRDIKINPTGNSFPPDEDQAEEPVEEFIEEPVTAAAEPVEETPEPSFSEPISDEPVEPAAVTFADTDTSGDVLKVSARSRPSAVAGAIAGVVRELGKAEVQAIGAGATNQAVKAVAIAREYLRETGIEAVCLPSFIDVTIENEDRTAILLVVEAR